MLQAVAPTQLPALTGPVCCAQGMLLHALAALAASSAAVLAYLLLAVLRPHPFWRAQYSVAYLGFVLSSSLQGVSAGLACVVEELSLGVHL